MFGSFRIPITSNFAPQNDWINISNVRDNEINLLVTAGNGVAFIVDTQGANNFTIDWGDGSIQTAMSGVVAKHMHLAGGTPSSLGYATWKIRIYDSVSNMIRFRIQPYDTVAQESICPILWAVFGTRFITSYQSAFYYSGSTYNTWCRLLKAVTIPSFESCTSAESTFYGCSGLTTVNLPSSWGAVLSVSSMFESCSSLAAIKLPSSWGQVNNLYWMLASCTSLASVKLPASLGLVTNFSCTFLNCTSLVSVTLPDSWGIVDNVRGLFYGCNSLEYVYLPSAGMGLITNAENMFYNCCALKAVTNLPNIGHPSSSVLYNAYVTGSPYLTSAFLISAKISKLGIYGSASLPLKIASIRVLNTGSLFEGTSPQIDVSYTSLDVNALVALFTDLPVRAGKVIKISGASGAASLSSAQRLIATNKSWTITG